LLRVLVSGFAKSAASPKGIKSLAQYYMTYLADSIGMGNYSMIIRTASFIRSVLEQFKQDAESAN